ncbi:phage major capsid protein [Sinorhizobium mexicanum]|nr:phage major capsid protein [Sinorhizobium mexicanum]MBP1881949.1 hypothetical protein [Sinorhizobium mexicanum]
MVRNNRGCVGVRAGQSNGVVRATLRPYAVKLISTFTEDLAERSQPSIEALLRKVLGDAVGTCLDETFFGDQAATAVAPAGILAGVTVTPPGTSFAEDAKALVAALTTVADPVFVVSPATRAGLAAGGGLLGFDYPVFASSSVPDTRMIAVDADALATGFGGEPTFSVSREATLVEQTQDTVGPISTPGTPNVVAAPTRSLWQTDSAALKAALPVSWYARSGGAAFVEPLGW